MGQSASQIKSVMAAFAENFTRRRVPRALQEEQVAEVLIRLSPLKIKLHILVISVRGFSGGSAVENLPANAGDAGSIPGSGRSPGEGNGHPLQDSLLGNPMDRGAWWATVHGVTRSWTRLSDSHFDFQCEVYEGEGHLMTGTVLGVPGTCTGWLVCSLGWSNGLSDDSSFSGVNGPT